MNVFKSIAGRAKIREYYNNILSFFPLTQRYVDTSFGKTFVLEAGVEENPAIILLHGSCSNSAAWLSDIAALAEQYHIFAVDILGEPGNSEDNRLDIHSNNYPHWLNEVLDALKTKKAIVIGNSMGGWLALHFAATYPQRTAALALLAPSGIIAPEQSFVNQTTDIASNSDSAEAITDAVIGNNAIPKEVLEFMKLVLENFNPITEALPVLTDEQMRLLSMPILYIAGTNDVTMNVTKAADRLTSLVPHANISLTEGAHVITSAADKVIPFLSKQKGIPFGKTFF